MRVLSRAAQAAAAVVLLSLSVPADGEEKHGLPVYPGARLDQATTDAVREGMKLDATCYRTADSVAQVTAFYKKQAGITLVHEGAEGSLLRKGTVDVTAQRPWMDMKTGAMNKDTLISIVKTE